MRVDSLSIEGARRLLGLNGPAGAQALGVAFRAAVKAARPDHPGGDADRFLRVILAYRLLQTQIRALPAPQPQAAPVQAAPPVSAPPPLVVLTPMQALTGGSVMVEVGGRRLLIHVPPGVRTADRIRLKGCSPLLRVLIRPADGLSVLGADLFMDQAVAPRMMRDGGRIEIDTHAGPQAAWLVPDMVEPVRLCLRGLGLPARGRRRAGDLFVRLIASDDLPSAAEDMLLRFTRVWTPQRMAA
ncbi:J domain-containing protein [Brevundimonas diminuta]|uniref:J domain-containing protein n=1 Tax=Brevundimonas diminuta TaxID=293 RepID=UPI003CFF9CE5